VNPTGLRIGQRSHRIASVIVIRGNGDNFERRQNMDEDIKKTALRMIPYGLYVLTAEAKDGKIAAATVNWVTQTAFKPPLVVVGVKADSGAHEIIKGSGSFALNILGKDQKGQAYTFFKALEREGDTIGGERFRKGSLGAPILENAPAFVECQLMETIEKGDHSIFVGEVKDAGVAVQPAGRPDDTTLTLKDLGDKVFYGG
jgi:flavin reductase (DIM6/NTAB) family NADH-FMN oxidoreductase RutF